jgi:fused signal recognition particle receptor
MTWIYLVLIVVVIAFGVGVLLYSRRRAARDAVGPGAPTTIERPPADRGPSGPPTVSPTANAPPAVDTDVLEPEIVEPDLVEPEVEPVPATLRDRLAKARSALVGAFTGILARPTITAETWEDLEEALIKADVGVSVADGLLESLRERVADKEITDPGELLDALRGEMKSRLVTADRELHFEPGAPSSPNVWMFVGVNGVGKTTTIGKLANQQREDGRTVLLAAGDTFRAAAAEQLGTWAERAEAELVRGSEGGDPSAVVFDAVERASARGIDLVLADTAGRLHTKTNLMEELRKVRRVAEKGAGRVTEVLLVIDATTGQNGLAQAQQFGQATNVTGVVLTKLDGSAKGGIVFAVETELGIPVKLVGVGETIGDLRPFDPDEFVDALFDNVN